MADQNIRRIADSTLAVLISTLGDGKTAIVKDSDKANVLDAHGDTLNYPAHIWSSDAGDIFKASAIDENTSHPIVRAVRDNALSPVTLVVENKSADNGSGVRAQWISGTAESQIKIFNDGAPTNPSEMRIGGTSSGSNLAFTVDTETVAMTISSTQIIEMGTSILGGARLNVNVGTSDAFEGLNINMDQTTGQIAVRVESKSTDQPAVFINIVSGDAHINLSGNSTNAVIIEGDFWRDTGVLNYSDGTTTHNLLIGSTLLSNLGTNNLWVGGIAVANQVGTNNTVVGSESVASLLSSADRNTLMGAFVAGSLTSADDSVIIGYLSGRDLQSGARNVIIGSQTGDDLVTGNDNIIIGYNISTVGTATSGAIGIGSNILDIPANTCIIGGGANITALYIGKNILIATPQAILLALTGENSSNATGVNFTLQPGNGTGNEGSGSFIIQTAPTGGSSGASPSAMTDRIAVLKGGGLTVFDLSVDPANPANGSLVLWQSDGTDTGADGDVLIKSTNSAAAVATINLTASLDVLHQQYDAIVSLVAADGDYTKVADAFNDGNITVFVRNGTYVETEDIDIPNKGVMIGESVGGVVIDFNSSAFQILVNGRQATLITTGTVAITNATKAVTGSGTTFTTLASGDFILLGDIYYKIDAIADTTNLTILETYSGDTLSGFGLRGQKMFTDIHLKNFTVTGSTDTNNAVRLFGCLNSVVENVICTGNNEGFLFEDFSESSAMNCKGLHSSTADGIVIRNCHSSTFHDCEGSNNVGVGIFFLSAPVSISLSSCVANNNGGSAGIDIANTSSHIIVDHCIITYNENDGVQTDASTASIIISNSNISNNGGDGMQAGDGGHHYVNNIVANNGGVGIKGGVSSIIQGNDVDNNGGRGILLQGSEDDCVITGNIVRGNGAAGIEVDTDDCVITGNRSVGNINEGVLLVSNSNTCIVDGNVLSGNSGASLTDNGTGNVSGDNVT